MKTIFIIILIISLLSGSVDKKIIDVRRIDHLNVSELAEKIISVPLNIENFKNLGLVDVYMINENLFIFQKYQIDGIPYSHVFRCDNSGNFKGELIVNDPVSNEPLRINDMHYDEVNKWVVLSYSDGYGVFDSDGKLLNYRAKVQSKYIFKEHFWYIGHSVKNGLADYSLVRMDLSGKKKDTISAIKVEFPSALKNTGIGIYATQSFSVHEGELYISFGIDNTINKVVQNSIHPIYTFEFKNRPLSSTDKIIQAPNLSMVGKYIQVRYFYNSIEYDFFYDRATSKSYNIKYIRDENLVYASGIKDDYFNTGFFRFNPTNREDYIFFFKTPEELVKSKLYNSFQQKPMIFLVKLK